jgi:MoaA/NifB/PqqE/SkfB family radical SAM enzyme
LSELKEEVDRAADRGNTYIDFTGGEPTLVPHLPEVIDYLGRKGMKCCVITNGIVHPSRVDAILGSGVDDWLVSVHGLNGTHDYLTANKGGFNKLLTTLDLISASMDFRFNVVINKYNTTELLNIAALAAGYNVRIVNFINFNPHHAWRDRLEETYEFIADLRAVQSILENAVDYLENEGRGVNVRYYPMCRIREDLRRVVCNDLHVGFDPYEWDYDIQPKTYSAFHEWCQRNSNFTEHKGMPCSSCDLGEICGGINKHFNKATNGVAIDPITNFDGDKNDFYWYRRNNDLTLQER